MTERRHGWGEMLLPVAGLCMFFGLLATFWVGYIGSDDELYWNGATGWLAHVPYVGDSHWSLRHTMVIPIALARRIFGDGMPALVLPVLLYASGLISVSVIWMRRRAGRCAAIAGTVLLVTNPQFILLSSTAVIDIVETFFIVIALFFLDRGMAEFSSVTGGGPGNGRDVPWRALLLAGGLAGLAMLSRETTIFAVAAVGLLFLAGYGMPRRFYCIVAAGFLAVVLGELACLWAMTGNPLYRSTISLHHDSTINRWVDQGAGIPYVHPLVDPVVMLLLNHNFGVLTWIGVPLVFWLMRRGYLAGGARRMVVIVGTVALTWTVLAAGLWSLLPLTPRYYLLPSLGLSMLSGIALARLWLCGRRRLASLLGTLLVSANLLALSADNRNFMFGEHILVDLASGEPEIIHTDTETLRRAALLLHWKKMSDRVTSALPASGDLYFFNPARSGPGPRLGPDWPVVERRDVPETGIRWLACHAMPGNALPPAVKARLGCGRADVTLYRVP
ncbi:glycosyltransferase family 39 protein [Telmatospirillum sp.]|uniref:glycosyltransferase family 39 protein n=1 Tax=Telmatospirillum sp. TaxID=2079197 RepID=UPI002845E88A|nr:glycosyltransferase family 39 protein [Telmatospirillum sp.]MDR3439925.1 glycosyltransferase family 39 protein [Telmatospirillum sp.]